MSKHKISDFLENYGDGIHGTPNYDENGTVFFINGNNLVNGKIQINANTLKITEEEANKIKRDLNEKTLLLSINGTLGNIALYNHEKIALGKSACFLNVKEEKDKIFLKYVLSTKEFKKYMQLVATGSTIKNLSPSQVANYEFELKDNVDKYKVSNLLSSIDNKIENNNNINAELESLAKTIYDYWFLQFEFPNEEGKPYKSSGGKMVWNEELNREIPEGWKTATLDKVISVSNERISSKEIGDRLYVPIECIPRKQMSFYETADIEKAATGLCPFDENSILISNRRVYFHKVSITPFKGVTRDTVIIVNPLDKNNLGYVFQLLFSDHFISFATLNSYGTEQPVFSPTSFSQYRITIPNNSLDIEYSKKVKPIINRILENQRENKKLSSLRDFLLPMLMNGQVGFIENE